jgi:hypothetical protein
MGADLGVPQRGTLQLEAVGCVDEAVADRVGQGGISDGLVPRLDGELAGDEGRGPLGAVLDAAAPSRVSRNPLLKAARAPPEYDLSRPRIIPCVLVPRAPEGRLRRLRAILHSCRGIARARQDVTKERAGRLRRYQGHEAPTPATANHPGAHETTSPRRLLAAATHGTIMALVGSGDGGRDHRCPVAPAGRPAAWQIRVSLAR